LLQGTKAQCKPFNLTGQATPAADCYTFSCQVSLAAATHATCTSVPILKNQPNFISKDTIMNIKTIAAIAASVIAASAYAGEKKDAKCGAGSCSKKAASAPESSCSKKDEAGKKDAGCSKKEASCSKKEAGCSKK